MTHPDARRSAPAVALAALLLGLSAAACVSNAPPSGGAGTISVESSATECRLSATQAPSGTITFRVTNTGDEVTEFYLLGADRVRIVGEVENIGPGISRDMVVQAPAGAYVTACKPGMTGDGIRADFTVTDSGAILSPPAAADQLATSEAAAG